MKKKIAFAGCAHIHAPYFADRVGLREFFEVKYVWDPDKELAEEYAAKLGAEAVPDDQVIWGDPEVEAVIITSETCHHRRLVKMASSAGKHMFVEKPLGFTAEDAAEMAEEVEKAGLLFQTGYFMRGFSINLFLKEAVEKGYFGRITRVRHCNCHSGSLCGLFDTRYRWMADPAIAGCGAYGDLGTHSLDIVMWLFGMPEKVFSTIHTLTGRYADCDEYGEGLLLYKDNMIATIAAGWVDCSNPVTIEICGTEGHALCMNGELYFQSSRVEGSSMAAPLKDLPEALPHAFDLFLDKLEGKEVPLVSVREAAERSIVMEALYKANGKEAFVTVGK